jgi:hypothetical protein
MMRGKMKFEFIIPLTRGLIVSEANTSEHWSKKSARHKMQRMLINAYMNKQQRPQLPCTITLTRIAPRFLDEGDNLPMAFKSLRDSIADYIFPNKAAGRADDSKELTWKYKQEKGKVKEYALKVEIENGIHP